MPEFARALVYILILSIPCFYLMKAPVQALDPDAKPAVWAGIWVTLTIVLFASQLFWVFIPLALFVILVARRSEKSAIVTFLLLFVAAPPISVVMEGVGEVNSLLRLSYQNCLVLFTLIPLLLMGSADRHRVSAPFYILLVYVTLSGVLMLRETTVTNSLRLWIPLVLMALIPVWVLSTRVVTEDQLRLAIIAFVFGLIPQCAVAAFEFLRSWHLYSSAGIWTNVPYGAREGHLRASASVAAPIPLGLTLMNGIALSLGLPLERMTQVPRYLLFAALSVGLVTTLSRGPWVGALFAVAVYLVTGPGGMRQLLKYLVIGSIVLGVLLVSPVGDKVLRLIPFVGSMSEVHESTEDYRVRLLENSIIVMKRHPWLGSVDYLNEPEMQEMIQGQQIIDVVNSYVQVGLETGFVGLSIFVSFFATVLWGLAGRLRRLPDSEYQLKRLMRGLLAALVGTLFTIFTVSSVYITPYMYWMLCGLCVAATNIADARLMVSNERRTSPDARAGKLRLKHDAHKPVVPARSVRTMSS